MQGERYGKHQHGYGKQAYGENLPAADGRAAQFPHMRDMLGRQPG